ncbi:MAG: transcriptional regulator, TetR family [Clostridiaceae bacterium]|jgi:AcrR family transcriptional regulator|nr:transcriptional regulator, TetR family [Clostridiaceae bacterium]
MYTISKKEKLAREKDIINAAEKVFTMIGYNGAPIEAIAKESQFTPKNYLSVFY